MAFPEAHLTEIDFEPAPNAPDAMAIMPKDTIEVVWEVSMLLQKIAEYREGTNAEGKWKKVDCPDCEGCGQVLFQFIRSTDREVFTHEEDCPTCDSDGKVWCIEDEDGNREWCLYGPDDAAVFQYQGVCFALVKIERVCQVAQMLAEPLVKLVFIAENRAMKMRIGADVVILLMTRPYEENDFIIPL